MPWKTILAIASNPLWDKSLVGEMKFPAALLTKPSKGPYWNIPSMKLSTSEEALISRVS